METNAAMLAAKNRTNDDLIELSKALDAHREKAEVDEYSVEEDLLFHLKIAEAGKNSVLMSLMMIITPDIMTYFKKHNVCKDRRSELAVEEHERILKHIREGNPEEASNAVQDHLQDIVDYVRSIDFKNRS